MRTEKFKTLFNFGSKSNVKAGDGLDEGNFPFYTSSSILKKRVDKAQYFDEALIFGTGGNASIHYAGKPFATSTDCIVAITKSEELKAKFVYYYLFGNIHILQEGFKGAGLKHISKTFIGNLEIPILPIETQNKIINVLDNVNSVITKREEIISLIDELLRATFLNLFGDPFFNSKKFTVHTLKTLCQFITKGTTPKNQDIHDELFTDSIPFLKVYHITDNGSLDFYHNPTYVSKETHCGFLNRSKVFPNDILMNIVGPPLGKIGIVPFEFAEWNINQAIVFFRTKDLIRPTYLLHALRSKTLLKSITDQAVGVRQQNISLKLCRNIKLPVPELELQENFEKISGRYSSLLIKNKKSLSEATLLRNSLFQKVFNGELNFAVDFELDALIREIDIQKKENDLSKIVGDIAYLQRLVDKLNNQEFKEKNMYDKAKHGVFQLMAVKEENRKVIQEYDEKSKGIKLALK